MTCLDDGTVFKEVWRVGPHHMTMLIWRIYPMVSSWLQEWLALAQACLMSEIALMSGYQLLVKLSREGNHLLSLLLEEEEVPRFEEE
jgi:hypothetical protein